MEAHVFILYSVTDRETPMLNPLYCNRKQIGQSKFKIFIKRELKGSLF
jgi:hypothetical protein